MFWVSFIHAPWLWLCLVGGGWDLYVAGGDMLAATNTFHLCFTSPFSTTLILRASYPSGPECVVICICIKTTTPQLGIKTTTPQPLLNHSSCAGLVYPAQQIHHSPKKTTFPQSSNYKFIIVGGINQRLLLIKTPSFILVKRNSIV